MSFWNVCETRVLFMEPKYEFENSQTLTQAKFILEYRDIKPSACHWEEMKSPRKAGITAVLYLQYLLGECVISLVLSHCSKNLKLRMDQCYSSVTVQIKWQTHVTAWLQLSFIWQAKENTSLRHEGGLTQKTRREERPPGQFWLLFLYVFSPSPEPALCKLG